MKVTWNDEGQKSGLLVETTEFHHKIKLEDGEVIELSVRQPIYDENGEELGYQGATNDNEPQDPEALFEDLFEDLA